MDDEPHGFCCKHIDGHPGSQIHSSRNYWQSDTGSIGISSHSMPVILINYLLRTGHVVYYPGVNRGICGNVLHNQKTEA